ncbi:hypothetical protein [Macrococcoides caseolyticum]|nr:hypothetical protein [Macrococcus caseolyticus]
MGEDAVKAILDLKDGKKIKSVVKVPLKLVEQYNSFKNSNCLNVV